MFDTIEKIFSGNPPPREVYEQAKSQVSDDIEKIGIFMVVCMLMYFLVQNRNSIYRFFRNHNQPANNLVDNLHTLQSIDMQNSHDGNRSLIRRLPDINDVDSDDDAGISQQSSLQRRV